MPPSALTTHAPAVPSRVGVRRAHAVGAHGSMLARLTSGKLTIVDLAGSERVKKSGADEDTSGRRMREAIHINSSLLVLSNVMKALSTQVSRPLADESPR